MSIKRCKIHGHWEGEPWRQCPWCALAGGSEREKPRKTFLGMTAVSWFLFSYIAVVLIAIAWIVIAHVPVKLL